MSIREIIRDQLDMTNGCKRLDISGRRAAVDRHSYNLIIGLGGMGVDALTEVKDLIRLTCEDSDGHIRYLGIDTLEAKLHRAGSDASGRAGLNEITELCLLKREVMPSKEDFDWIDERVLPLVEEAVAGGVRQAGRLILTNRENLVKVKTMITEALTALMKQNAPGEGTPRLNVFILTGLGGGTGGGMFIDMAYLVRQILDESRLPETADIFGYLFMPDVTTEYLPYPSKAILERNAYAALQELDYNMSLQDLSEKYTIRWGNTTFEPGNTPRRIFDHVHLVSATDVAGHLLPDPRHGAIEAVAQNILSFVTDEIGDTGVSTEPSFSISSCYNHTEHMFMNYRYAHGELPHRCDRYLALGSCQFTLPIDDIMMYTASLFFERMDALFQKEPGEEEHLQAERDIGIQYDQLFASYRRNIPLLQLPPVPDYQIPEEEYELKGREIIAGVHGDSILSSEIRKVERYLIDRIKNDFHARIKSVFLDENLGPIYAYRLITNKTAGLTDRIDKLCKELPFGGHMEDILYAGQIKAYRETRERLTGIFYRKERIADFNTAGRKLLDCFTFYALVPSIRRVYEEVAAYIKEQTARIYELSVKLLDALKEVFESNARILTAEDMTGAGNDRRSFRWEKITIPQIEGLIRNRFDEVCPRSGNLIRDFEWNLWEEAADRRGNENKYDPKTFISRFINRYFSDVTCLTIEDAVKKLLGCGQTIEDAWEKLFRKLYRESEPLFYAKEKEKLGTRFMMISVPENCPELYRYIAAKAREIGGIIVLKTRTSDRIIAQTVQSGITLSNSQLVENAEKSYALLRKTPGTHLIASSGKRGSGDYVSWMEMSTLTPGYLRADLHYLDPEIRELVEEERAKKEEIKCLCKVTDEGIVSRCPALEFRLDGGGVWEMLLRLTDVKTERIETGGGRPCLKISIGENSEVFLPDTKGVVERLSRILNEGFSQAAVCTPPVYAKEEVITYRQWASRKPEDVLDFLTEQYITALVNRRRFLNEVAKYDVIYGFLNDVKAYQDEDIKRGYRVEMFTKLLLMERIFVDGGVETRGEPALIVDDQNSKMGFGILLPRCMNPYERQYYLYDYYYACCDDRDLPDDLCVTPVQREQRRVAFTKAAGVAEEEFEEALADRNKVHELLDKVIAMKEDTAGILARSEIIDALNGIGDRVPYEMANFFKKLYVTEEGVEMYLKGIPDIADKTPREPAKLDTDLSFVNFE